VEGRGLEPFSITEVYSYGHCRQVTERQGVAPVQNLLQLIIHKVTFAADSTNPE